MQQTDNRWGSEMLRTSVRRAWIGLGAASLAIAAPASACTGFPRIYFAYGSADLDQSSREALRGFALQMLAEENNVSKIEVSGHSDASGPSSARRVIAARRAAAVRDFLIMAGIPANLVAVRNRGDTRPEIETPDGVREPNNRRASLAVLFTPAALEREARRRDEMIRNGQPVPMC
jgi:outer membrane protein OmpA-like peptidoglycan-associated protein